MIQKLSLNETYSILASGNLLTLEGRTYCDNFQLDTLKIKYEQGNSSDWLTINCVRYFQGLDEDLVEKAYKFLTSIMKALHEKDSHRVL